jgi:beta-glucosidase
MAKTLFSPPGWVSPSSKACRETTQNTSLGAYNRVRGESASASKLLLQDLLRGKWGFQGYIVSDCDSIRDIFSSHNIVATAEEASALGIKRGCDIADGVVSYEPVPDKFFSTIVNGQRRNGVTVEFFNNLQLEGKPVRTEVSSNIKAAWGNDVPYPELVENQYSVRWSGQITVAESGEYALRAGGLGSKLNLDSKQIGGAIRGTTAPQYITLEAGKPYTIAVEQANRLGALNADLQWSKRGRDYAAEATAAARKSDVALLFLGLSPRLEGEEMPVQVQGFNGGDRLSIDLPKAQEDLMKAVAATGTPTVLVLLNGRAVAVNWADANIPAIVETWHSGQAAGSAIADVLFCDYNPGGRLPVTF